MTPHRPELVVIAGPNGSGKSTLTNLLLPHDWCKGCEYINPDDIAKQEFGGLDSQKAALSAAVMATERRETCLREGRSMAFESVLSAADKVDFIGRAKEAGYFVRIFVVGTDSPAINAARVAARAREGGHDVPIEKINSRYAKSLANATEVAYDLADRAYFYDNSIDGEPARLLFRSVDGELVKVHSAINEWATPAALTLADGKEPPLPALNDEDLAHEEPTPSL